MLAADAFPPGSLGVDRFDAMVARANASNILTLDVSTTPPDPSVPATVVATLGPQRASRFEIGNEVYDPRQGPPPNGYATAQDYLSQTSALVKAVRGQGGARAGVTVAPCPIFYPEGSACWGGVDGRYHQWHRNISAACDGDSCPFDAVRPQPCPTALTSHSPGVRFPWVLCGGSLTCFALCTPGDRPQLRDRAQHPQALPHALRAPHRLPHAAPSHNGLRKIVMLFLICRCPLANETYRML